MEHFDKHSDEALNELLRKYLLEESERDRLAEEALDMHADFVFSEEPLILPPAAKEQELISQLQEKVATGAGGKSYWRILWAIPVLVLMIVGLGLGFKNKPHTDIAQSTNPVDTTDKAIAPVTTSENHAVNETAIVIPATTANTARRHRNRHYDSTEHISVVPDVSNKTSNNTAATNSETIITDLRPQADLKVLTRQALKKMSQFITQQPSERIYVQTDRDVYQPGQDIWFTAYLRNEYDLLPSSISDIVKVQLSDPDGKIVAAIQLSARDGIAQGDIHLAYGLPDGVYHFKAYTNWQLNTPSEFHFEKDIFINEPDITFSDDPVRTKLLKSAYPPITSGAGTDASAGLRLEFYPEGGDMVAGHEGRIAFQVVDKNSDPVSVEGYVTDQNGNRITNFTTTYRGMGMFALQPQTGGSYTAHVIKPAGIKNTFALPKVTANSLALAVLKVERDNTILTIHSPADTKSLLIIQVRGQIVFTRQYDLKQGDNTIALPTRNFPAGVAQFTLFNAYGEPTAERLAFVNRHKLLNVQLVTDKAQYQPREKVRMNVKVTDDKGQPVQGHFSLSVHDAQPLTSEISGQGNIISKLLLEADLSGHIDDAGAYFDTKDAQSANHLDLLLMTRGWRKFSWKQLLTDAPPVLKYPYEKGVLKGVVVDPLTGRPLKAIRIEIKGSNVKMLTNEEGKFEIHKVDLSEPKEITLSYKSGLMVYVANKYDENMTIQFYTDNRHVYPHDINDAMHPVISGAQKLPKDSAVIIGQVIDVFGNGIPNANVTAKAGEKIVKTTTTNAQGFYTIVTSQAGEYALQVIATGYQHKILKAAMKQGNSMIADIQLSPEKQLMSEIRIAEERARINVTDPNVRFNFLAVENRLLAAGDKNTILENTNEQDKQDLAKLFNETAPLTNNNGYYFNGIKLKPNEAFPISNGRLQSIGQQSGLPAKYESASDPNNFSNIDGNFVAGPNDHQPDDFKTKYYKAREFPSIKYKNREFTNKPKDFRSTVYWNGTVHTDIEGKATVEFYNSDDVTTFAAEMEGISEKGMPGNGMTLFNTQLPFKVHADVPMVTDQTKHIEVPVYFSNTSGLLLNGKLEYHFPEMVKSTSPLTRDYTIFPPARDTLTLDLDILQGKSPGKMDIIFNTYGYRYVLSQYIGIVKAKPEN